MDTPALLHGLWQRVTDSPCSAGYPTTLRLKPTGLYHAQGGALGPIPGWDIGTFEVVGEHSIRISTANDARIVYQFALTDDTLEFVDPQGCRFAYTRVE